MSSICKFVSPGSFSDAIHIINCVYEVNPQKSAVPSLAATYRICYVISGEADICMRKEKKRVKKNDVFFVFPSEIFSISGDDDFRYMYISFLGTMLNAQLDKLKINLSNFIFENMESLYDVWYDALSLKTYVTDLVCEGIIFYTLAKIADKYAILEDESFEMSETLYASQIKNYIDENFKDFGLSLKSIGKVFSYNKQYISRMFREQFKIGITEYVSTLRIGYACTLIEKKHTNVAEIAHQSGFEDALYFSKVFKNKIGQSPKQYIKNMVENRD